jgi:hypothetical protein
MSATGPRIERPADPTKAVEAIRGTGRRIVTFAGFSGGGYEEPTKVGELLAGFLAEFDPASVIVCSGATAEGIGDVYPIAKERGFETIGIVSAVAEAEHARLSDAVDTVYIIDDTGWGGRLPDGTLSPTSTAMVAAAYEIIAIGGGDIARDEIEEALAAGKRVRYRAADMNHAVATEKARQRGEPDPQDFKGAVHIVMRPPARCDRLCQSLSTHPTAGAVDEAASLLLPLRDLREFERLCALADLVCRLRPDDAKARRLYAQGLIETGRLTAAVDMLEAAKQRYGEKHAEYAEFEGLLGRAYKQLFMDTDDPQGVWASTFIKRSFEEYSGAYTRDPARNFWHGINLGALRHVASLKGVTLGGPPASAYTSELLTALERVAPENQDQWWSATKAEAHAARGEWDESERALRAYIDDERTTPFMLASTLRQLRDLWGIQRDPSGAQLLQTLEAVLMRRSTQDAVLKIDSAHLREMRELEPANDAQLQQQAGPEARETIEWYREGLKCAASVASVKERLGLRFGTGFAVRSEHFGVEPGDEILLLTNFHVLNSAGRRGRKDFGNVEVAFEAIGKEPLTFTVRSVVAESNADNGLDYALLRLAGPVGRLQALKVDRHDLPNRPVPKDEYQVFIIGYPRGDVMQISLRKNALTDHECGPTAKPPVPARRRLQYTASTEPGSSGSPVFDDQWGCIALHHAGPDRNSDLLGIPPLNGKSTAVLDNEGIWIGSIIDDVAAKQVKLV